jgi:hypothetical protein
MSEDATMKKFHPILRVAVMLVENGLIHTVRHLEDYLARVGKVTCIEIHDLDVLCDDANIKQVFSESFADYSSFITTAARSCLAVSEDPRLDYTRIYDTAVESQLYSEEYVVSKIFEEELDYMVTSLQDEESARAPDYQIPAASTILPECREAHPDPFLGAPDLVTEQNDIFDFMLVSRPLFCRFSVLFALI